MPERQTIHSNSHAVRQRRDWGRNRLQSWIIPTCDIDPVDSICQFREPTVPHQPRHLPPCWGIPSPNHPPGDNDLQRFLIRVLFPTIRVSSNVMLNSSRCERLACRDPAILGSWQNRTTYVPKVLSDAWCYPVLHNGLQEEETHHSFNYNVTQYW